MSSNAKIAISPSRNNNFDCHGRIETTRPESLEVSPRKWSTQLSCSTALYVFLKGQTGHHWFGSPVDPTARPKVLIGKLMSQGTRVRPVRSGSGARVRVGSGPVRVLDRVLSAVMAINTKRACQILPQPRKAKNCSKSSFSGLWTEFQKQPMNTKRACQILPQPRKAKNCSKSSFSGLWTEFQKQPMNTKRACQILPQPRKAKNCSKSSFSRLWTEFQKQPMNTKRACQILPQPPRSTSVSE